MQSSTSNFFTVLDTTWTCDCGSIGMHYDTQCRNCNKDRPKIAPTSAQQMKERRDRLVASQSRARAQNTVKLWNCKCGNKLLYNVEECWQCGREKPSDEELINEFETNQREREEEERRREEDERSRVKELIRDIRRFATSKKFITTSMLKQVENNFDTLFSICKDDEIAELKDEVVLLIQKLSDAEYTGDRVFMRQPISEIMKNICDKLQIDFIIDIQNETGDDEDYARRLQSQFQFRSKKRSVKRSVKVTRKSPTKKSSRRTARKPSPRRTARKPSPKRTVRKSSPKRTVRKSSPKRTVRKPSPKLTVRKPSLKRTVRKSSSKKR